MTLELTPLVSLFFRGATLTEHDDLAIGAARIGCPVWGSAQLLANLELRLGLPQPPPAEAVRVQQWSRRMGDLEAASPGRFYARSYALDSLGTATTILSWRDELVTAGWNGEAIDHGGARLDTIRQLDDGLDLRPGLADRLCRVERELQESRSCPFDAVLLAEPVTLWPGRWQRIFAHIKGLGGAVRTTEASFDSAIGDSDLSRLQALLRGDANGSPVLRGDGSIVFLRAETSWELADATAALLRTWNEPSTAILRGGESCALDSALVAQGLASQGLDQTSAWRPALQILPLAVELAFEPRDPYRVLELLTLPIGPFHGLVGRELSRALAQSPGIGGPAWKKAKEAIGIATRASVADAPETSVERRLAEIEAWLEAPGHDALKPAPTAALLVVANRVCTWLQRRLAFARKSADEIDADSHLAVRADLLGTAYAQAQAFHEMLSHESRPGLDLVDARLLVEQVTSSFSLELATERAGRIDVVDSPAAFRRARDVVIWWHCAGGTEWRTPPRAWRRSELEALRAAQVLLPDPAERLAADARDWHQVVFAARKRLVLAVPRWAVGEALDPHPIWHEIAARFGANSADIARISLDARQLLAGQMHALGSAAAPPAKDFFSLRLPAARNEWQLDPTYLGVSPAHSAASIDALVGCPLQWVLKYPAGLRPGALASLPPRLRLMGTLGHRLIEELHGEGRMTNLPDLKASATATIERLVREEAAVFLRAGMTFELMQFRDQLIASIEKLAALLREAAVSIVGVELVFDSPWRKGTLSGRLDLLLRTPEGRDVVLDLKWGKTRYLSLLESGTATQLAIYAAAHKTAMNLSALPPAAYFCLSRGELLAMADVPFKQSAPVKGPALAETWTKLERTVERVEATLRTGRVPVTGLRQSAPLLKTLGVGEVDHGEHISLGNEAPCQYCAYGALCGRNWEAFT